MDKFTDLPSCQKMNSQVEGLDLLLNIFPQLNKDNINLRQELQKIKSEYYSIFENAEKFNTYFLDRGWCYYGLLNSDLLQRCVKLGDAETWMMQKENLYLIIKVGIYVIW